jgi:hypothetical protein
VQRGWSHQCSGYPEGLRFDRREVGHHVVELGNWFPSLGGRSVGFYALADGVLDVKNYHGLGVGIALAQFVG